MNRWTILFVWALFSSCAASKKADLEKSMETYVRSLIRGDDATAVAFVLPKHQGEFTKNLDTLRAWHVSNAEVKTIFPDEEMKSAVASVAFEFYSDADGQVKSVKRYFRWEFNEKINAWQLADGKPYGVN